MTVIILSLRTPSSAPKYLYTPTGRQIVDNVSPYLIDAPSLVIEGRTKPLSKGFPRMNFGNMPNDGGALLLTDPEKKYLTSQDPIIGKFIRPLVGSEELIQGKRRYCLWIEDKDLPKAVQSKEVVNRIEQCRRKRLQSRDTGTRKLAQRPHQFRDRNEGYPTIIIPRVSSEARDYIPMDYQTNGKTIVLDSALAVYDAPMWLFAVLTSRMHMTWVRTIGGKLETRYRYSAQICYNTFPFPKLSKDVYSQLEAAAEEVLLCRADYVGKTLAELYDPKTMPEPLRQAHAEVDRLVDACYRPEGFASDEERLAELFRRYASATR
nr:type IIL restriction-modification enzyme MmeI [uncultured Porphyromonas sp.]